MSAIDLSPLASRPMEDLAADRDRYLATGEIGSSVRPVVRESWRRCREWGVSPSELKPQLASEHELDDARRRSASLLHAAGPCIDTVHATLATQPHVVAISDADGLILRLLAGPGLDADSLSGASIVEGASWHERVIGCNGIGTALAAAEPVILIGPEHFQEAYTGWTCIGVPLRDRRGDVVGALDLSVPNGTASVHTWGWTLAVAGAIEARLASRTAVQDAPLRGVPALEDPFHAIRGVLDLLANRVELAPTHAAFLEEARREVDSAEDRLARSVRDLVEREERLRLVIDNSPDATFIQDAELRYVWGGSRAGPFAADEYIGRTDEELFDAADARMLTELKRRVMRDGRRTTVDMTVAVRGRRRRLQATFEPARQDDGAVVGLFGYVRDVTEEWRTREALRESHARLRAVLDIMPAGVWIVDAAGRVLETNSAAADLWGGHAPLTQRPEDYSSDYVAWWPDGRRVQSHEWGAARALREGAPVPEQEIVIQRPDGRRNLLYFATPLREEPGVISGALVLAIDITERKLAEERLRSSEERFRKLADASSNGLLISDERDIIHYANRNVLRLLGYTAADVSAGMLHRTAITAPGHAAAHVRAAAELEATGACAPYEAELIARDGSFVPVLLSASELELSGEERPVLATFVTDLSPLRAAERALTESEARFRTLANAIPQLAWMADNDGTVFWYNERWYEYTGASVEQLAGDGWKRVHHPDHVARVEAGLRASWRSGRPFEDTFPIRGRDGAFRWFLTRAVPVRNAAGEIVRWIGTSTDITAQRAIEEARRASEERLRRIAESGMVGVVFWEIGGRITYANDYLLSMLGFSRADVKAGRVDWRAITPPEWQHVDDAAIVELMQRGATSPFEKEFLRNDGTRVPVLLSAASFTPDGQRGVTLVLDITERRRAEAELQRLYEEAQEAVRQREEVVGVVSHDLRNPLSTIAMASALLLDPSVPEDRKANQATVIRRAVEQMMRLIQDLLDVSRMGASRFSVHPRQEDAASLVRTAAQLAANSADARGLVLEVGAPAALPAVHADRQRILQVFDNLLANAFEFTPRGGRVVIGARATTGAVVFSVSDTGPGIPHDEQPHVFDRFWQGRRRAGSGAGLGLTICKGIVEAHGGSIEVASEPGGGAIFRFSIPTA